MAKVEQGRTGGTRNKRTGAKAPVSAHPAFAVIVALWFAALLGIGSLIIPISVIEKLVVATGLPSILSAAQPPLGFTARAAIALLATVAGAVIGVVIALQVARSNRTAVANRSTNPADLVRRPPVNAHAELGSDGFDGNGTSRRRKLALATDEIEEQESDYRAVAFAPPQTENFELDDALVLEDDLGPAADQSAYEDDFVAQDVFETDIEEHFADTEEPTPFAPPAPFASPFEAEAAEPLREDTVREDTIREDLAELGLVQLVQKLEATIEKHRAWLIEKNQRAAETAAAASGRLPEPTMLDTAEAFGTIQPDEAAQAREAYFEAPTPAPAATDEDEMPGAADVQPAPIATLAGFAPEHANEDEGDQEAAALSASFALPFTKPTANRTVLRHVFQPEEDTTLPQTEPETRDGEDDAPDGDEAFANLNREFAHKPLRAVRIEEPETEGAQEVAVTFPGQLPTTSVRSFDMPKTVSPSPTHPQDAAPAVSGEDADRALREVLRNLQRMGKAS